MNQPTSSPEPEINLDKELAEPQTPKYTIRTMAQDLERARKEGVLPIAITKAPPPPPPIKPIPPSTPIPTPMPKSVVPPALATAPVIPKTLTPQAPIVPPETLGMPPIPAPALKVPIMPPSIPTKPSVIPPPAKKPSRISFAQLNLIVGVVAVAIILIGSIGFSYWWFFVRVAPIIPITEQPKEEPKEEKLPPAEPILPQGILITDQDIIIEVSEKSPLEKLTSSLISQISESTKILSDKKLARILIKYSSETEKRYLSFAESIALLDLTIPNQFVENITGGEILTYNQNGEIRYGLAIKIINAVKLIDIMKDWEKTLVDDLENIYMGKTPTKPENMTFKDFSYENFIIRYLNLPTPDISMTWGVSDAEKTFVIATSKDMMFKIIGYKEAEKPVLRTFQSGTLVRSKGDTKIYRIIDDKKLWVPTVKAFIDSGYPVHSEIEILPEELAQYQTVKYIKLKDTADIYEIKNDKKYLVANPQTLSQNEIKISTYAEFIAYPIGQ